jgi:uncharacterized protein DUF6529
MDIIGFLNDVTGGNLLLWKVIAATLVLAMAGLQIFFAARLWDESLPPKKRDSMSRLHRINGRLTLLLAVLVAISCLVGPAGPTSPARVFVHSLLGTSLFALLVAKFTILRIVKKGYQALPVLGIAVFLTFGGLWATSVFDFVTGG